MANVDQEGPDIVIQQGHSQSIRSLAVSPDDRYVATASNDATIRLWDRQTGGLIRLLFENRKVIDLSSHPQDVMVVRFSPDGRLLAAGLRDGTLRLWLTTTGEEIKVIRLLPYRGEIFTLAFSQDSQLVATAGRDKTVRLWATDTGEMRREFEGHADIVRAVGISPDGRLVFSGDMETIRIWDIATGKLVRALREDELGWNAIGFSEDGHYVATGNWSGKEPLLVRELETDKTVFEMHHEPGTSSLAFSTDTRYLVAGGLDGSVTVFDMQTGKEIQTITIGDQHDMVQSVTFSRDAKGVLVGYAARLALWDWKVGKRLWLAKEATALPDAFAFLDPWIILKDYESFRVWDRRTGQQIDTLELKNPGSAAFGGPIAVSRDRQYIACNANLPMVGGYGVGVWEITGKQLWKAKAHTIRLNENSYSHHVAALQFSEDGRHLLSGGIDGIVYLWDTKTGKPVRSFEGQAAVSAAALSPDGQRIVAGYRDGDLRLWDATTGNELWRKVAHVYPDPEAQGWRSGASALAFSPTGEVIASGGSDGTIILWNSKTGQELKSYKSDRAYIESIAYSPDGKYVATGNGDDSVVVWDISTVDQVRVLSGTGSTTLVAFSQDGRQLISASPDNTQIKIWDVGIGRLLATLMSFGDDDWAAYTPQGFFAASPKGESHIGLRVGMQVHIEDGVAKHYRSPEHVSEILNGGNPR